MNVRFVQGDLLDSEMQTLINTVNCKGIMGKGIALEFKNRYPEMFRDYVNRCSRKAVNLGEPYIFPEPSMQMSLQLDEITEPEETRYIINFPTKDHWRSSSRLSDIEAGLSTLGRSLDRWGVTSLAIPPLGCGNGGLDWCEVGPMIRRFAENFDIDIEIYVPPGVDPETPFALCSST